MISCAKCQADPCQMVPCGAPARTRKTNVELRTFRAVERRGNRKQGPVLEDLEARSEFRPSLPRGTKCPYRPPRNPLFRAGPIVCVTCCAILDDSIFAEEKRFDGESPRRTRTVKSADDLQNFTTGTNAQRTVRSASVITARFVSVYILFSRASLASPNYANRVAQYKKISPGTGVFFSHCLLQASGDTVVRGRFHPK